MSRLYPDRPILGCLAVVRRGSRILLVQRAIPPDEGKWGFPGGRQELGETVATCAIRELQEETGILADPREVLTVLDVIRRDEAGRIPIHFALVCVLTVWRSGEGELREDALALGWFTPEEVIAGSLDTSASVVEVMHLALGRP